MALTDEIASFLMDYRNDWPTLDDVRAKFPSVSHSSLHSALSDIYTRTKNPILKKRAFRAQKMRNEHRGVLWAIEDGKTNPSSIVAYLAKLGIKRHKNVSTIKKDLILFSKKDKDIQRILKACGIIK